MPRCLDWFIRETRSGPVHEFHLATAPAFLTEALALENARETLRLDGLDVEAWTARPDRRTKAPDGSADYYLCRNSLDPNEGSIYFVSGPRARQVRIELKGDVVYTHTWLPK
jgi:hypothetical protein